MSDYYKRAEMRWMSMEDATIEVPARWLAEQGREVERLREAHEQRMRDLANERALYLDACDEIKRLRGELRWIVEQPTKIFPGNVTAYVPNYVHDRASAALGGEESE